MNLPKLSLKYPLFVLCFWGMILFLGIQSFFELPVFFLPRSEKTVIGISTPFPGAGRDRVLEEVTKEIEEKLRGAEGVDSILSTTSNELSKVTVYFKNKISVEEGMATAMFAEKQARLSYPKGVEAPIIERLGLEQSPFVTLAIVPHLPLDQADRLVKDSIKPAFEEIEGVSHVTLLGERTKQISICLDLEKMKQRQISASAVSSRLEAMGENFILGEAPTYRLHGRFSSIEEIGNIVINYLSNDKAVLLKEIAELKEELSEPESYAYFNKDPCLILNFYQRSDANPLEIQKKVSDLVSELKTQHGKRKHQLSFSVVSNANALLKDAIKDLQKTIWIAIICTVFLILAVFGDLRSILISCLSIPCSFCGAFLMMNLLGISLNFITLGAIILSVGLIVDDMIIVRENIFNHLEKGEPPFKGTLDAMKEISHSIIGTTFTIVAACGSLLFIKGDLISQINFDFALTVICAMGFSLLEALTLGPVSCAYCLKSRKRDEAESFSKKIQRAITGFYVRVLRWTMRHSGATTIVCLGIVIVGFGLVLGMNKALFPRENTSRIQLTAKSIKGLSLKEIDQRARFLSERFLQKNSEIEDLGMIVFDNGDATYHILAKKGLGKRALGALKKSVESEAAQFRQEGQIQRYFIVDPLPIDTLYPSEYTLFLSGKDRQKLLSYSQRLVQELGQLKGLENLSSTLDEKELQTSLFLNFAQLSRLGFLTKPVAKELDILLNGYPFFSYYPMDREGLFAKQQVKLAAAVSREEFERSLRGIYVPNLNYTLISLEQIIRQQTQKQIIPIQRRNSREIVTISGDFTYQLYTANPIFYTDRLLHKDLHLPKGLSFDWLGKSKDFIGMMTQIPLLLFLSVFFTYMILILLYRSLTIPLLILVPLPLSISGSFFALFFSGESINLFSVLGCILAVSIAAKNGIILIDYANKLASKGTPPKEAVVIASESRFRPILMTSFSLLIAVLAMLLGKNQIAQLVEASIGIAILGGLVTSSLLSLILLPNLFNRSYRLQQWCHQFLFQFINTPSEKI